MEGIASGGAPETCSCSGPGSVTCELTFFLFFLRRFFFFLFGATSVAPAASEGTEEDEEISSHSND